jgi:hypothetical protein
MALPLVVACSAGGWLLVSERGSGYVPVGPNPFAEIEFTRLETGVAIPEILHLRAGTGFFAEVRIIPKSPLPTTLWDERRRIAVPVQPPLQWCPVVAHYPHGYSPRDAEGDYWSRFGYYFDPKRPKKYRNAVGLPMPGSSDGWHACGYRAPPQPPADLKLNELRFWTYLAARPEESGEIVYEIKLLPTAHIPEGWAAVRRGPNVVVWRGVMRITNE